MLRMAWKLASPAIIGFERYVKILMAIRCDLVSSPESFLCILVHEHETLYIGLLLYNPVIAGLKHQSIQDRLSIITL